MKDSIINNEATFIRNLAGDFPRHPRQINRLMEADAEIIRLIGTEDEFLVLKTDGIHEEIKEGLYEDPYLVGWMCITAPMSDIAAVGAQPTGILLSLTLPQHSNDQWLQQFKAGINAACKAYNTYVLGGDTNFDGGFSVSATAVASIKSHRPLLRSGVKRGDYLYATASLGLGNAYAYYQLFDSSIKIEYQPVARLLESRMIAKYASACIDTSDGLFPALSVLSEINKVGFELTVPLQDLLHPSILPIKHHSRLPAWMFMAGPHGEYELLLTIPEKVNDEFQRACEGNILQPLLLGNVIDNATILFSSESLQVQCHPAAIANLFSESNGNIQSYFERLLQQHQHWTNT
jgi:thiamine-monophosphate kinase